MRNKWRKKKKYAEKEEGAKSYDFKFQLHKYLQDYEKIIKNLRVLTL